MHPRCAQRAQRERVFLLAIPLYAPLLRRRYEDEGKLLTKRNTFSDFIACADHLVGAGWTAKKRVAAQGGSAGGLLMGVIANERPDLWAAVLAEVPFVGAFPRWLCYRQRRAAAGGLCAAVGMPSQPGLSGVPACTVPNSCSHALSTPVDSATTAASPSVPKPRPPTPCPSPLPQHSRTCCCALQTCSPRWSTAPSPLPRRSGRSGATPTSANTTRCALAFILWRGCSALLAASAPCTFRCPRQR
jgi:hypothetical protein